MEAARATWTDSRLDDLNDRVKGIDAKVTRLDRKMDAGFVRLERKMDEGFSRRDERIDKVSDRMDSLQHTIVVVGGGLFAAFVSFLAAVLGLIVTLLLINF